MKNPRPQHDPRLAYLLVNLATLFWSTNFALGRLLRNDIGPFTLTAARFVVAALIYIVLFVRLPADERKPGKDWLLLLGMGFTGIFAFGSLLYAGLRLTTTTNAALINGISPLAIGALSALLLAEHLTRRGLLGALISLCGVAVIVSNGSLVELLHHQPNAGDLFVLAAVTTWGFYSILSRVATRSRSVRSATILSTWFGLPFLFPAAIWEWQTRPPTLSLPVLLAAIYIGVFPSVVSFLSWNEAVRRIGPARVTAFYNMLPVYGALLGVVALGEPFGWPQLIGGGLIIAGSLISVWRRRPLADNS